MKKRLILQIAAAAAMLGLIALLVVHLYPLAKELIADTGDETRVVHYIESYGVRGVPILLGLEALQIIVAFIPEAAVNVLSGLCYGVWWGALISIAGIVLGNVLVFVALRQLKHLFEPFFRKKAGRRGDISPEMISRLKRPELIAFFFFLIPCIPNGIVPYVFAQTKISLPRYLLAVAAGLVPSTFLCTFLGERLSNGHYTTAIIVAAVFLAVTVIALLFRKKLMAKITSMKGGAPDERGA
ncbi:MAG: VTT domain-containing protein [Oscillospiraceae bacterium]|nr:VTT domain-containing protein [Oscillospiraceae bacterium]